MKHHTEMETLPRPGGLELWFLSAGELAPRFAALAGLLSPDEHQRAARLVRPADRDRFILFRGILREILGRYEGVGQPADLVFTYGPAGKPTLAGHPNLHFNLTHAADRMVLAVAGHPVGVDVEPLNLDTSVNELARRFFRPEEAEALVLLSGEGLRKRFFRLWTAKEALLKAFGWGLGRLESLPSLTEWAVMTEYSQRRFAVDPGTPQLSGITASTGEQGWLWAFPDLPDWSGSLASAQPVQHITLRTRAWWPAP